MLAKLLTFQNYYDFFIIYLYVKDLGECLGNYSVLIKSSFLMCWPDEKFATIFSIILFAPIFSFAYFMFVKYVLLLLLSHTNLLTEFLL